MCNEIQVPSGVYRRRLKGQRQGFKSFRRNGHIDADDDTAKFYSLTSTALGGNPHWHGLIKRQVEPSSFKVLRLWPGEILYIARVCHDCFLLLIFVFFLSSVLL